jgi:peptidoglycan/LPS O-acetylase OafA/YrhL
MQRGGPHLDPVPGWDGLRGLAVLAVVVYHLDARWLPGGFLGVSAFFTLSGFLITSLLITEWRGTGSIDLRRFWTRRARRLFPALAVVLLAVLLGARSYASAGQLDHLRGDTLATLGYVANWRYLLTGVDYGGVAFNPSPLLHTWSLAIEEQFYLLFPLVVVLALRTRRRHALPVTLLALLGASLGMLLLVGHEPMRVYYGTDVRAAELLIGALGALAFHSQRRDVLAAACRWLAPAALVGLAWSWHSARESSPLLGRGGLALHALGVLVLVVAVAAPGPLGRASGWWPLRQIGLLSYGIYLIHWPVFLWLTPLRTGWSIAATDVARLALTLALAVVSYRLVEQPVRHGRWPVGLLAPATAAATTVAIVAGAVVFTAPVPAAASFADTGSSLTEPTTTTVPSPPVTPPPTTAAPTTAAGRSPGTTPSSTPPRPTAAPTSPPTTARTGPPDPSTLITAGPHRLPGQPARVLSPGTRPRIAVVGDSLALTLGYGLEDWAKATNQAHVYNEGWIACGIVPGGDIRWVNGIVAPTRSDCNNWPKTRAKDLAVNNPHLVVVLNGLWEMVDRRLPGDDHWQHIGQPAFDAIVKRELSAFSDLMASRGAAVVWLTYPRPSTHVMAGLPGPFAEEDPARVARLNQIIGQVVASHPGSFQLDLRTYMRDRPGGELDLARRPDGFHWTRATADLEAQWLGPLLMNLTRMADAPAGA